MDCSKVNSKELKHLIYNEEIIVYIPDSCFVRSELVQKEIRKAIEKAWKHKTCDKLLITNVIMT